MGKNWLESVNGEIQLQKIMETNEISNRFGLTITREDALLLTERRKNSLKEQRRVEFGGGILPAIIYEFSDSAYLNQDNYAETLAELQDIFYLYKNEVADAMTDDELLHFMKEQFETVCFGDVTYLSETCLSCFAEAVRAGYRHYEETDGYGAYAELDPVPRFDWELFSKALSELES